MEKSFTALAARIFVIREEIHIFTSFLFVFFFFVSSSLKFLPFFPLFTFPLHEKCLRVVKCDYPQIFYIVIAIADDCDLFQI
jgi:hypothetical protein